ncbi:MAG: GNAT family N-acetyltransferase [Streptococcaceae bacterium]|jgi:GNAT superfamily N-acetyltransferase|nr:GNAT family N-acetyltransferase [Streptococcaceae bacterium]
MELKSLNRSQLREVTEIWAAAEDYGRLENAEEFDALESAKEFFDTLPPGKSYADKQTLGVYDDSDQLMGLVDLAKNYPIDGTYFLGLLLLVPSARANGLGHRVHEEIISLVRKQGARKLRLGVLVNNPKALKFWQAQGYEVLKQTKQLGSGGNSVYLLELPQL